MNREVEFAKTLETVRRMAKEQNNVIAQEQVREAFRKLELSEEQLELVYDYLRKHQIGIGEPVDPMDSLTQEDTDYLSLYLEELKGLEEAGRGETEAVTLSAMAGDMQAKARLVELYLPRVVEVARLYAGQGVFLEDLIGEGNVALAMGVEMLGCLESREEVQGMLGKMMMDAMEDLIGRTLQEAELDRQILTKVNEVNEKAKELAESLLRKVSIAELAEETGIPVEEIREALRISAASIEYLETEEENSETDTI